MVLLGDVSLSLDIEGEDAWIAPCSTTPPVGMCWKTTPPLDVIPPLVVAVGSELFAPMVSSISFTLGVISLDCGRCQTGVQSTRPPMTLHSHVREDCTLGRVLEDTRWVAVSSMPSSLGAPKLVGDGDSKDEDEDVWA